MYFACLLQNYKHTLTIWCNSHAPGINSRELKIYPHKCKCRDIAILFIIAQTWRESICPSIGQWINKLWYNQTLEYFSVLKRNDLLSHKKKWKKLVCILPSEKGKSEKNTNAWLQLHDILEKYGLWVIHWYKHIKCDKCAIIGAGCPGGRSSVGEGKIWTGSVW